MLFLNYFFLDFVLRAIFLFFGSKPLKKSLFSLFLDWFCIHLIFLHNLDDFFLMQGEWVRIWPVIPSWLNQKATWFQFCFSPPSFFPSRLCSRFLWCVPDCVCLTPLLQGTPGGAWDYIDSDRVLAIKVSQILFIC